MAKGCVSYAIDEDRGAGWNTVVRFRTTPEMAERRFAMFTSKIPNSVSARLTRVYVVSQRDREWKIAS